MSILVIIFSLLATADGCIRKDFGMGSIVCVCNATYCDFEPTPAPPASNKFIWYVTSKSGKRLSRIDGTKDDKTNCGITITIDPKLKYQEILGFGGAFTDAAGINIAKLNSATQNMIMRSYFTPDGANYNLGRVPIAGTDFSTREYTYDDVEGDKDLKHFALAVEDHKYKIPYMKTALKLNPTCLFYATSWTAPPWMKTNDDYIGYGTLKTDLYQTYTNYLMNFLDAYKEQGLNFWGLSTGNEPTNSWVSFLRINTMSWSPTNMAKWISLNLGPSLERSQHNNTKIMALDDQRYVLPWFLEDIKEASEIAYKYISGIALHWYTDEYIPVSVVDKTHNQFSDKFILMTEACTGERGMDSPKVSLGSWIRATRLIKRMIENFNHWIVGWIDWNLVLDKYGSPNWVKNFVDAPIIVEPANNTFYKQPLYYAMAHFSKFIPRGSVRIGLKFNDTKMMSTAFKAKDQIIVVLYNPYTQQKLHIRDTMQSSFINIQVPENSINTIIYRTN